MYVMHQVSPKDSLHCCLHPSPPPNTPAVKFYYPKVIYSNSRSSYKPADSHTCMQEWHWKSLQCTHQELAWNGCTSHLTPGRQETPANEMSPVSHSFTHQAWLTSHYITLPDDLSQRLSGLMCFLGYSALMGLTGWRPTGAWVQAQVKAWVFGLVGLIVGMLWD